MKLPHEVEYGNIEYKLKVTTNDSNRIDQLASQMKWRINEGNGEANYYLGVDDDGSISGINSDDYLKSYNNLLLICKMINVKILQIEKKSNEGNIYYKIKIVNTYENITSKNVMFIGEQGSGKSTIIGNLFKNIKDDGNGKSKQYVFNHKHEIFSGVTSSISVKNLKLGNINVNLIDTPGKEKYRKTMISAIMKYRPNLIFLVINPMLERESNYYLDLLNFLGVEFGIIYTNKDKYINLNEKYKLEDNIFEVSNLSRYGYSKIKKKIKNCKILSGSHEYKIHICDIMNIPNMGKIYTAITNDEVNFDKSYYLHSPKNSKRIYFESVYFLDKPIKFIEKNHIITFKLRKDNLFINKTDLIISTNKNIESKDEIKVSCNEEINSNNGICIYNNQYMSVNILKQENNYLLTPINGKFINLSEKIFLKVNDIYFNCDYSCK
tara:strand:- start:2056 stop:3366 length:1311 start_codon:yes stop_codon:yes gene_type:complete